MAAGGEVKNRRALGDIKNLVTVRGIDGKKLPQVSRHVTRSFCAQLVANAQAATVEKNKTKPEDSPVEIVSQGVEASVQHADVVALTKLVCLVLPHEHSKLLQPNSIWNADHSSEACSLVEQILHLKPLDVNSFQGITLPDAPQFGKVFGGCTLSGSFADWKSKKPSYCREGLLLF